MSRSDLEIMREVYAAFARRDLDSLRAAIHPDFVMEQTTALPWGGQRHGPDGFFAFLGSLLSYLEPTVDIEDLYDAGDHIVQIGHTHGTVRDNGAPFSAREVHIWRLADSKIISYRVHVDINAIRTALDKSPAS